ncbi:hypothetical protein BOTBODRAFT_33318 [Botryobasidium botryosum FD-172 SS1]|uniref:Uncharacterized protein n=1 Tax=Botryobasidium botryosum (strain FD-172 SS1) TaxID=930990 RepID=A0A067MFV4_BOTB1|nr:hypothetical protein BOTBODRAFT_33318 [Botryobasidium botryosum FD-172 SS1]
MDPSQAATRHADQINVFIEYQNVQRAPLFLALAINVTALWPDELPREIPGQKYS